MEGSRATQTVARGRGAGRDTHALSHLVAELPRQVDRRGASPRAPSAVPPQPGSRISTPAISMLSPLLIEKHVEHFGVAVLDQTNLHTCA